MVILKSSYNSNDYQKAKEEINKYTDKLIKEGWEDLFIEGGVVSPDRSTLFIYSRSPYNGQLIQFRAGVEKEYNNICNELIECEDFCKI